MGMFNNFEEYDAEKEKAKRQELLALLAENEIEGEKPKTSSSKSNRICAD